MIVFKSQFKIEENIVNGEPLQDEPYTHNDVTNTGISVSFSKSQGVCHMHLCFPNVCVYLHLLNTCLSP